GTELAIPAHEARPVLRFAFKGDPFGGREPLVDQLSLTLGVFDLRPASQDPLPGEEYAELFQGSGLSPDEADYERHFLPNAPLVLEFGRGRSLPTSAEAPSRGKLEETVLGAQTQTVALRLSLIAPTAETASSVHRLWVYDSSPQLFSEVRFAD